MEFVIHEVSKSFQKKKAVNSVSLHLHQGIVALLGANGSGKTTLLRMLVGNLQSDHGSISYDGVNIHDMYDSYASILGYMPQHLGLYPNFTIQEFLKYMALLKGLDTSFAQNRILALLEQLSLVDKADKKIKTLSGGMLKRVGIAQSLLNHPKILILDEPTAGLDPKERIVLRNIISHLGKDTLVILSTHIVSDVESIADEIIVMKEGEILLHDTPSEILSKIDGFVWEVVADEAQASRLENKFTIVNYQQRDHLRYLRIVSETKPDPTAQLVSPTLDDLYLFYFQETSS